MSFLNKKIVLLQVSNRVGTGWLPPIPDLRDYQVEHPDVQAMTKMLGLSSKDAKIPSSADLRQWCSPIEDQGGIGSCTANAVVGVVEYLQRRAFNEHLDGSRLFVYKTTRNLMQVTGDTGAWIRNVLGALALCGVPEEKYWPYNESDFDNEPPAFVYAVAENFEALKYFCHDPIGANISPENVVADVKRYIAAGIPSVFGFWGFPSFGSSNVIGGIPLPGPDERAEWGHAVVAVGYDDEKRITNTRYNQETVGAFLIRNSWGKGWGEDGYGWIPYDYVLSQLALDFWSLLSMEWVDTEQFGI